MSATNLSKHLDRKEGWCYFGIVFSVGILAAISQRLDPSLMQTYFGEISPYLLLVVLAVVGGLLVRYLRLFQFELCRCRFEGFTSAVTWAALFGMVIIGVEHIAPLNQDINAPYPGSLAFYPAISFYVEIIFHVIPLAFLLFFGGIFFERSILKDRIWIVLFLVALLEPFFQTIMSDDAGYPMTLNAYIALHIFLINLTQLHLYRKYDFVSMLLFRLVYYLIWHVVWGHFRLEILF